MLSEDQKRMAIEDRDTQAKLGVRIGLWLGIANGGGLVAAASALVDGPDKGAAFLVFPSCWFFTLGLLSVGLVPWIGFARGEEVDKRWAALDQGTPLDEGSWLYRKGFALEQGLEIFSAIMIVLGLVVPLIVASINFHTLGKFA